MATTILFPSSYYGIDKVDEDMKREYDAVRPGGCFRVILFGYRNLPASVFCWFDRVLPI